MDALTSALGAAQISTLEEAGVLEYIAGVLDPTESDDDLRGRSVTLRDTYNRYERLARVLILLAASSPSRRSLHKFVQNARKQLS